MNLVAVNSTGRGTASGTQHDFNKAMRDEPTAELIELLQRLRLADAAQVQGVAGQVRKLAGELPHFQSVWVDALAQARILTAFQAGEINAGRWERLLVGPYVLSRALPGPGFASCYAARHIETGRSVRILVANRRHDGSELVDHLLKRLVQASEGLAATQLSPIDDAGSNERQIWATCPAIDGQSAADWMVE